MHQRLVPAGLKTLRGVRAYRAKADIPVAITFPVKPYGKGTARKNARGEGWDGGIGFNKVHKPGQEFDVTIDVKSDQVARVEFYDCFLQPGVHVLIAVAVMKDGTRATSHPAGMVVEGDMYAR